LMRMKKVRSGQQILNTFLLFCLEDNSLSSDLYLFQILIELSIITLTGYIVYSTNSWSCFERSDSKNAKMKQRPGSNIFLGYGWETDKSEIILMEFLKAFKFFLKKRFYLILIVICTVKLRV
jgi:hypothetical protein